MSYPLVSVIIPSYNRGPMIADAVESALTQTYPNVEVVVVDDGSEDNTLRVLEPFGSLIMTIRLKTNKGAPLARNTGFAASHGDWIQFLDSDDILEPDKIGKQMELIKDDRRKVAYGPWRRYRVVKGEKIFSPAEQTEPLPDNEDRLTLMLRGWFCPPHSYLYPRDVLTMLGGSGPWDEALHQNQDIDLAYRIYFLGAPLVYCAGAFAYYQDHDGPTVSGATVGKKVTSRVRVLEKVKAELEERDSLNRYAVPLSEAYFSLARDVARFDMHAAEEMITTASSIVPRLRPKGRWPYRWAFYLFGFRFAQRFWMVKERITRAFHCKEEVFPS